MSESSENPRMPLTTGGIAYLFLNVAGALGFAYFVIAAFGILDAEYQYYTTITSIVFFIGVFFCKNSVLIGLKRRTIWSFVFGLVVFSVFVLIDITFDYFFKVDGLLLPF